MADIKILFGKRVKKFRQRAKLSQEELAEKIGIAVTNMGKIERGESFVTANTLEKLAYVLDVEVKELFDFEAYKSIDDMRRELRLDMQNEANMRAAMPAYMAISNNASENRRNADQIEKEIQLVISIAAIHKALNGVSNHRRASLKDGDGRRNRLPICLK